MADLNVAIEMTGKDNVSGVVGHVVSSLGGIPDVASKATGLIGGLVTGFGAFGLAATGVKSAVDLVVGGLESMSADAVDAQKVQAQLASVLESTGGKAGVTADMVNELADKFSGLTPFEDEAVTSAESMLLTFTNISDKVFPDAIETVLNMSQAMGTDLQGSAIQLGKALNDPTQGMTALTRVGVTFTDQQKEQIKTLQESGDLVGAQGIILKELSTEFGGAAKAAGQTFGGQLKILQTTLGNVKEAIFTPVLDGLTTAFKRVGDIIRSDTFQSMLPKIGEILSNVITKGVEAATNAFGALFDLISTGDIGVFADDLRDAFNIDITGFVEPIRNAEAFIAEFSTRIGTFYDQISSGATLATTVNAAFGDLIPDSLNPVLDSIDAAFAGIKESVMGLIAAFQQGGLAGVWQQITDAMSAFAPTGERISAAITGIGAAIKAIIPQPVQDFVTGLLAMGTNAKEGFDPISALADIVNTLSSAIEAATKFVKDHVAVQAALVTIMAAAAISWGISAAINAYATAVSVAQAAVQAYTAVQAALNVVLSANPIGLVIIALGALTAGLIYAYQNSEEFRNTVDSAFATVKTVVLGTINAVNTALGAMNAAVNGASATATAAQQSITGAWAAVEAAVSSSLQAISSAITGTWDAITGYINSTISGIQTTIMDFWNGLPPDIQDDLETIWGYIQAQFSQYLSFIQAKITAIGTAVAAGWNTIVSNVSTAMESVNSAVQSGWETVSGVVTKAMGVIQGLVEAGWTAISAAVSSAMETVSSIVSTAWEAVRAVIEEKINAAIVIVQGFATSLAETLGKMKETAVSLASGIGEAIVNGIKSGASAVWGALVDWMTQQIRDLLGAMAAAIKAHSPSQMAAERVGAPIMQGVAMGIQRELPTTVATATNAATAVVNAFSILRETFDPSKYAWTPFGALNNDIKRNTEVILSMITDFNNKSKQAFSDLDGYLRGWIASVVAHRTELLKRFNYAAFVRGEGTKVLPELNNLTDNFIRDTTAAASVAAAKMEDITRGLQDAVMAARADAYKAAQQVTQATVAQVRQIQEQAALNKEIKMQKDAFATMQRQAKDYFDAQQAQLLDRLKLQENIAQIGYTAALKLSRVGVDQNPEVTAAQQALDAKTELYRIDYEAARDTARATTDAEREEIQKRADEARRSYQDQLDEQNAILQATMRERNALQVAQIEAEKNNALQGLIDQQNQEIAVREATAALRQAITDRQTQFDNMQAAQSAAFEESMDNAAFARQINQIYAERDARIKSISDALQEKEKALTDAANHERNVVLDNLTKQLQDYKTKYIDGITEAFHHAGVDIADFLDTINNDLGKTVDATIGKIAGIAAAIRDVRQQVGFPIGFVPQGAPLNIPGISYPTTTIPAIPSTVSGIAAFDNSNPTRVINLQLTVNGAQPVTKEEIIREINRSLSLAGV